MKSRASLTLMEQLIMVLIFALAAALCLKCFAAAAQTGWETTARDRAVVLAQNGAEVIKATRGDLEETAKLLGGDPEGDALRAEFDGCKLEIQKQDSGIPGLGRALVQVIREEKVLFSLTAAWQEVS